MLSNQRFDLMGHINPFGRYPTVVIPVGKLNDKELVAVIPEQFSNEIVKIDANETFVPHNQSVNATLTPFDCTRHRLFAFDEYSIQVYSLDTEETFFDILLRDFNFSTSNPFLRLALAIKTKNIYTKIRETLLTLIFVNSKMAEKDFINKWYAAHLQAVISNDANIKLPVRLKFLQNSISELPVVDFLKYLSQLRRLAKEQGLDISTFEKSVDESFEIKADFINQNIYQEFVYQTSVYYQNQNNHRKAIAYLERITHEENALSRIRDRIHSERAENLERAIHHFRQALEVYNRQAYPVQWASTQNNLANAYRDRILGERAENLEQAIHHFQQALEVYNRVAFPEEWATTQNNLANAYKDRIHGERAENLERAGHHFQQALEVYNRQDFPGQRETTEINSDTLAPNEGKVTNIALPISDQMVPDHPRPTILYMPSPSTPPNLVEMPIVDVVSHLDNLAKASSIQLNWRQSINDLMALLGMDHSPQAIKDLAVELGCPEKEMADSYNRNVWTHQALLKKIAENGGNIPKNLLR